MVYSMNEVGSLVRLKMSPPIIDFENTIECLCILHLNKCPKSRYHKLQYFYREGEVNQILI